MTLPASTDVRRGWLIVEDESLIAMLLRDAIAELGLPTVGPVGRVARALQLVREQPVAGALLDINVAGEPVYPVADRLVSLGVPFAFLTGYRDGSIPTGYANRPVLQKPFAVEQVQAAIRHLRSPGGAS